MMSRFQFSLLQCRLWSLLVLWCGVGAAERAVAEETWPALPQKSGVVTLPAQEWPQRPGPRSFVARVVYPGGALANVTAETGVMLTLHNWGGQDCAGAPSPEVLARELNVVALCVDYLQSGRKASIEDPEPYDHGYLQALDALRALWFICDGLRKSQRPFDAQRIYCTGGSGGGNVTQMAAKLAPRTFACIVDLCGMKKLSHDVAFNLPGGSGLNARWRRDPQSSNYLSADQQEIRFVGHPTHLETRRELGDAAKIVIVHGVDDHTCPIEDARELVANLQRAGFDVEPFFVGPEQIDGKVFTSTGHALGNRTEIVLKVAGKYLRPHSDAAARRVGEMDFQRGDEVRYRTTTGEFVVSYRQGFPVAHFEVAAAPPAYPEHHDLSYWLEGGARRAVQTESDWRRRREHILAHFQSVTGPLPGPLFRPPLDVRQVEEARVGDLRRRKITYQSDPYDRVAAYLFLPQADAEPRKLPAVLCLHQTTQAGKDEPAGLTGPPNMHYALELARRGYVVLAPDYPSLGEHAFDFAAHPEYASGTMKAIWDNCRAVDLLESLPQVDARRLGVIGHSLGGHSAMFTAALEPRLKAIVSSCGFTCFAKDDLPSWTGPRYMPRIAAAYGNDPQRMPFDFGELIATFAPRPFLAVAAQEDADFDVGGVRDAIESARPIYELLRQGPRLQAEYPAGPHDFPAAARQRAYEFLDAHLKAAGEP